MLRRRRKQETAHWYRDLKESNACMDCGSFFHHASMEFDHMPGSIKETEVSELVRKETSRRWIIAEMEKCELVCANCHAVRTFNRSRGVAQPG